MEFTDQSVTSKDGTQIGYRSIGEGAGIVFVQGTMGTTENFTQLAQALANSFTIYLPERRGRGISPKDFTADYSIEKEVEDIDALLTQTNARYIFGLSSGGIITLQTALELPGIKKIAVYEPPLMVNGLPKALNRFNRLLSKPCVLSYTGSQGGICNHHNQLGSRLNTRKLVDSTTLSSSA